MINRNMIKKSRKKPLDYFDFFCQSADYACSAAVCLHQTLQSFQAASFRQRLEQMHGIEKAAGDARRRMMQALAHEFIPPIEREDIVSMANALDRVAHGMGDILRRMEMFRVTEILPDAVAFSALLVRGASALKEAVADFRHFRRSKTLGGLLIAVNTLKSEGDLLHAECIRRLFRNANDPVKKLIWTMVYEDMKACMAACGDAAGRMESVMMKNL